jgi:hypothetical protein
MGATGGATGAAKPCPWKNTGGAGMGSKVETWVEGMAEGGAEGTPP